MTFPPFGASPAHTCKAIFSAHR